MEKVIKVRVKTLANLFIGGAPRPFEIGGIDQWTAVDEQGFPCIPASSWKGALRAIAMRDMGEEAMEIGRWYAEFLERERTQNRERLQEIFQKDQEAKERIEKRYEEAIRQASACALFGIREFNHTPKVLFDDLRLIDACRELNSCFSIDTKTEIRTAGSEPRSNPRTYKAVKKGMVFEGNMELYGFEKFGEEKAEKCREYLMNIALQFNKGIYRLGNSKSRGYGKVDVSVE
ncbi:MAG TPA: CRISPR-associated protein Csm3 [Candidatus Eisenbergiella pullicola]|nr:CRISPR-associated protein Csm3 [Candidatus Eisenbergiella pullicola]